MNEGLMLLVRIVLSVLILPVIWACGVVFYGYVQALGSFGDFFLWGMFAFLLMYLFFYKFFGIYELGQKFMTRFFKSAFEVGRMVAMVIPFYLTIILLLYYVALNFLKLQISHQYFMYFSGFAFAMHVILTAQDLQQNEKASFKVAYLFQYCIAMVLMVFVTVLLFGLVLKDFAFLQFFSTFVDEIVANYSRVGDVMVFGK